MSRPDRVAQVYGGNTLNVSFDFCSIGGGLLCPLPTYNFNGKGCFLSSLRCTHNATQGSGVIPLDFYSNILGGDVSQQVPSLAYVVPDIEAFAQLELRRVEDNEVVACVQSTLSNGWSLHQPRVSWTTGIIAFFALLASLFQSRFQLASLAALTTASSSPSYATTRFIDLLHLLQHICITVRVSSLPCIGHLTHRVGSCFRQLPTRIPSIYPELRMGPRLHSYQLLPERHRPPAAPHGRHAALGLARLDRLHEPSPLAVQPGPAVRWARGLRRARGRHEQPGERAPAGDTHICQLASDFQPERVPYYLIHSFPPHRRRHRVLRLPLRHAVCSAPHPGREAHAGMGRQLEEGLP